MWRDCGGLKAHQRVHLAVQVGRIETPSKDIECAFAGDVDHGISRVVAGRLSRRVIYERHVTEIRREQPDARRIDASRLDAEVAVRMAVTGHSREQIAKAIVDGARASRLHEDRNWQAYARRAAERAFGAPGEHARVRLEPLRDKLLRLEGRQDERQLLRGLGGPARGL